MTVGLTGVVVRPLHEVVERWKKDGRRPVGIGELARTDCLCGDVIKARNNDVAIARAVKAHNDTPGHRLWAITNGWRNA
jgi:hypothetical protein